MTPPDELKKAEEISLAVETRVIDRCLNDGDTRNADKYWREETTEAFRRQSIESRNEALEEAANIACCKRYRELPCPKILALKSEPNHDQRT